MVSSLALIRSHLFSAFFFYYFNFSDFELFFNIHNYINKYTVI